MFLSTLSQIFNALLELMRMGCLSDDEKDLEIPILGYQLGIADRKLDSPLKPLKSEKLILGIGLQVEFDLWI